MYKSLSLKIKRSLEKLTYFNERKWYISIHWEDLWDLLGNLCPILIFTEDELTLITVCSQYYCISSLKYLCMFFTYIIFPLEGDMMTKL